MSELGALYEKDYTAWAHKTAELIRAGRFADLDIAHLLEELEGMGASERNELANRFEVLLAHLLKWQFQYRQLSERWREFKGDSWNNTIKEQRRRIERLLRKTPGLKSEVQGVIAHAYQDAREDAADETGLPLETFPATCPYSQAQILDKYFYPLAE
jgi:hypothetical protein